MLSCEYYGIFKNDIFIEHPRWLCLLCVNDSSSDYQTLETQKSTVFLEHWKDSLTYSKLFLLFHPMHLRWKISKNCVKLEMLEKLGKTWAERLWIYDLFHSNRDCPKYEDILPNGMCHKYLKTNRIAQTVETMHRKNKDLFGFYEIGFKFIKLWFTGGTPKMSFIKQWLGECFTLYIVVVR